MRRKLVDIILLTIAITPVFILPLFGINQGIYWLFSTLLIILEIYAGKYRKEIFPAVLFFTLVFVSRPVNIWFTKFIHIEFSGSYFLIPIVLFTILIISIPDIKKHISWWRKDKIDKDAVIIILGLSVISGLALIIWGNRNTANLSKLINSFPVVPLFWTIVNGIGFAVFNSIAEEYLTRGMLCNGLEKIFSNKWAIIFIQAVVFSIFHYYGFPGGISGMIMVFSWSIVLGIIRYKTNGLIGVLIGHFFADITIYFVLYGLK